MTITRSTVEVDGGRLDVEVWGDRADPAVLLFAGESLAHEITDARFRVLPGVGHELPERAWRAVVEAVADHLAGRSATA